MNDQTVRTAPNLNAPVTYRDLLALAIEIERAWTEKDFDQDGLHGVVRRTTQMAVAQTIRDYVNQITAGGA